MQTGRPARIDELADDVGPDLADAVARGVRGGVGAPIRVDGHLWGFVVVAARAPEALPQDTEERLTDFTELVGTAIANAEGSGSAHRLQSRRRHPPTAAATLALPLVE